MKTEAEIRGEVLRVNMKLHKVLEIARFRDNEDGQSFPMQYFAVVEALRWVLGEHQKIDLIPKRMFEEALAEEKQ
jgi:hypothetical protein